MRRSRVAAAAALLVVAAASAAVGVAYHPNSSLAAYVPPPDRPPPATGGLGWLTTSHDHVVDSAGRTVILRGFNDDALLNSAAGPAPLQPSDAALMRRSGFDLVRLPIAWSLLEPRRGRIDRAYVDRVVAAVRMFNANGIWVVLDMHVGIAWNLSSQIPAWARVPAVPDIRWFPVDHWKDTLSPSDLAGLAYFWVSQDWQRDFALCWRVLAARLRDDPGLVGYDIYNEPHSGALPPRIFEDQWMWPFYRRMVSAIGSVDPNHLFIVESTLFANFPTEVDHLSAPGTVYSPHFYTGSLVAASGPQGETIAASLAEREREAARVPAPLWIGEVGIDHTQPGAAAWTDTVISDLDRAGVGWAWWQWRQDSHWGVRERNGTLLSGFLRQLARPFLAAAPAGVEAGLGDGVRGALDISVAPSHAAAPIMVSWPGLTLPPPTVGGACVESWRWDPGSARIAIRVDPAAGCRVSIRAA